MKVSGFSLHWITITSCIDLPYTVTLHNSNKKIHQKP
jgi:hypothetical protein